MQKKFLAATIALIILVLMLNGCGQKEVIQFNAKSIEEMREEFKEAQKEEMLEEVGIDKENEEEMVKALPYLAFTESKADLSLRGVTYHEPGRSYEGINFIEGKLFDMRGEEIHDWGVKSAIGFPLQNGDLLTYYSQKRTLYIARINWEGEIIWKEALQAHHEIRESPWGTLFLFGEKVYEYENKSVEFDTIIEMNMSNGRLLNTWSTKDLYDEFHQYHPAIVYPENFTQGNIGPAADTEYYHANTINFVPENDKEGTDPMYNQGNLILTFRHGNIAFIFDRIEEKVLWYYDDLQGPHSTFMDKEGNIVTHDNGFLITDIGIEPRQKTRILKINGDTKEIVWEFNETNLGREYFTPSKGCVDELANGNYLISNSDSGQIFEVTPSKDVVWEYWNPNIPTKGVNKDKRATIYRAHRYPLDYFEPLNKEREETQTNSTA